MGIKEKMKWLKKSLKNKKSVTLGLMISFLISGNLSVAAPGEKIGGQNNTATGENSGVVAGNSNTASGVSTSVVGGASNKANGESSSIVGGFKNTADGEKSGIIGGSTNATTGRYSGVLGGASNKANGESSSVVSGFKNTADGEKSGIIGGSTNITTGRYSGVLGGVLNKANGEASTVVGGAKNTSGGKFSSVLGGENNKAEGVDSAVVGGSTNTAKGVRSIALGGGLNIAEGQDSAVLAGGNAGAPNIVKGENSVIAGGAGSTIETKAVNSGIFAGYKNKVENINSVALGGAKNTASGKFSTVIGGVENQAIGQSSAAIGGYQNRAEGQDSAILGGGNGNNPNVAKGHNSIIAGGAGNTADTTGENSGIFGGYKNKTEKVGSVVLGGLTNTASGERSSVLAGSSNKASGSHASVVGGAGNKSEGVSSVVIGGTKNTVSGNHSAIIGGVKSTVAGIQSVSVGSENKVDKDKSIAIGYKAHAKNENSYAFGNEVVSEGKNSFAIGHKAKSVGEYSFAVGNEAISEGLDSFALGKKATSKDANSFALGTESEAKKQKSFALGYQAKTDGDSAYALGAESKATAQNAFAIGYNAQAKGDSSYALGNASIASKKYAYALGIGANAQEEESYAIGHNAVATKKKALAIGNDSHAKGESAVALGTSATTALDNAVALGSETIADVDKGVAGHDFLKDAASTETGGVWSATHAAVSVGKADGTVTRQINGVAAGTKDSDAVNVAQIKALKIGKGKIDENDPDNDKTVTGKTVFDYVKNQGLTFTGNVGSEAIKLGESFAIEGTLAAGEASSSKNVTTKVNGKKLEILIAEKPKFEEVEAGTGANKVVIGENKISLGGNTYITSDGIDANNKKIANVADGVDAKDAVNKGQLDKIKDELEKSAKDSVVVKQVDGETKVTKNTNGNVNEYTVGLADSVKSDIAKIGKGKVEAGDQNTVTGDTVHKALKDNVGKLVDVTSKDETVKVVTTTKDGKKTFDLAVNKEKLAEDFAKKDASNLNDDNVKQWAEKLSKDANIATPDAAKPRLVTDKQVHDYVKKTASGLVDVKEKPNSGIEVIADGPDATGKKTFTVGLDAPTKEKVDKIGDGVISDTDPKKDHTVTGKAVHDYVKDNAIKKDGSNLTVNEVTNLSKKLVGVTSEDKSLNVVTKTNGAGKVIYDLAVDKDELAKDFAKKDASNIDDAAKVKWREKLGVGTGKIVKGDQNTVTGDTVHKHLKDNYYDRKDIDNKLGKIGAETGKLSGGIATSMAMGNIPQVSDRHLFSIGAGGAYYNKTGGFALGVSGTIPSRRFIYKVSAGVDTKKSWGVAAGVNVNLFPEKKKNMVKTTIVKEIPKEELDRLKQEVKNEILNEMKKSIKFTIKDFDLDKSNLKAEQIAKLETIVEVINANYDGTTIEIIGYTDRAYTEQYNLDLGLRRAVSVRKKLIDLGLSKNVNIEIRSRAFNEINDGNRKDLRRVEVLINNFDIYN
ncbi:OmpA family protein [Oceanivirga salmonicida]|uniref:OmpA family protein n=1 Tax=Oceanivirga salmonicida TaxID=1769291 RepID=UPI0012E0EFA8|nr:OmpA family protein [Oceanivirga salmonicida]